MLGGLGPPLIEVYRRGDALRSQLKQRLGSVRFRSSRKLSAAAPVPVQVQVHRR